MRLNLINFGALRFANTPYCLNQDYQDLRMFKMKKKTNLQNLKYSQINIHKKSCKSSNPGYPDMACATLRYQTIKHFQDVEKTHL